MVNEVPSYLKKDLALPQPLQCEQAQNVLEETVFILKENLRFKIFFLK